MSTSRKSLFEVIPKTTNNQKFAINSYSLQDNKFQIKCFLVDKLEDNNFKPREIFEVIHYNDIGEICFRFILNCKNGSLKSSSGDWNESKQISEVIFGYDCEVISMGVSYVWLN